MMKLFLVPLLATVGAGVVLVKGGRKVPERDLLRGCAFSVCVAGAYQGTQFGKDAERVGELYREVAHESNPALYASLDKRARALDAARPAMVDGANLALMTCLEFYESRELAGLLRSSAK